MPAKTTIVVADSASTPIGGSPGAVDHTFTPAGMDGNVHKFDNGDFGDSGAALATLTALLDKAKPSRGTDHLKITLGLPLETLVDGVPTVDHVNRSFTTFVMDPSSTEDERRDLVAMTINALSSSLSVMLIDLEDQY
jgi:hypothetical protein